MRTALCLYGLVGSKVNKNGKGVSLDPTIAANLYSSYLLKPNQNVDVFIHTWSHEYRQLLTEIYSPVSIIAEEQISFNPLAHLLAKQNKYQGTKQSILNVIKPLPLNSDAFFARQMSAFRACSRWYSIYRCNNEKSKYEIANNFKYDYVVHSRLDVGFFSPLVLENYDSTKFWASHWNHVPTNGINDYSNNNPGKGLLDFWFFSSSHNMNLFSELFLHIHDYHISPHFAAYQHAIKNNLDINYTLYRWRDHEMIRRKFFNSAI